MEKLRKNTVFIKNQLKLLYQSSDVLHKVMIVWGATNSKSMRVPNDPILQFMIILKTIMEK